MHNSVVHFQDH